MLATRILPASGAVLALLATLVMAADVATRTEQGKQASLPAPTGLTCEFLREPAEAWIFDPAPEFAWQCGRGERGYMQAAYRIVVRALSASGKTSQVIWDTGRIDGNQSINVTYDGPLLQPGASYDWTVRTWDADGNESAWASRQTFRMARHVNVSRTSRAQLQILEQEAETVTAVADRTVLVDFGKAAFGYLKLRVRPAAVPRELEVRFGERRQGDRIDRRPGGSIRYYAVSAVIPAHATELIVRPPRDERNTSGDAVLLPLNIGVVAPFHYVEILGDDLPADLAAGDVVRCAVQYPFDRSASAFESSDPVLNEIWELCKYSIEATTFCGVYVDGDRERIPYEADAYINQLAHYGVDQEYALARYSHEYLLRNPTWPTEWKQHSVLMAWVDYLYTGNKESLAEHYDTLRRDKTLVAAELPSGLLDTSEGYRDIVDWPEDERDGYEMLPINTVVNAFHYATLVRMAKIADALDRGDEAEEYREKSERFYQTFNAALWSDQNEAYVDGVGSEHSSIHANLFPLALGLVPDDRVEAVLALIKSRKMACSVYAAQYLLEALYENGASQYAYQLLTSQDKRSWYNMLRVGSTITLEAWDKQYKPNLDWNHAWGAAPANLIPMYLVGVRPLEPGFEKIVVQPRPAALQWFKSRVPTIRGPVDVHYRREGATVHMDVTLPGNCTADIGVPLTAGEQLVALTIDGREASGNVRGEHAWIEDVAPGRHQLVATFSAAITQTAVDAPAR